MKLLTYFTMLLMLFGAGIMATEYGYIAQFAGIESPPRAEILGYAVSYKESGKVMASAYVNGQPRNFLYDSIDDLETLPGPKEVTKPKVVHSSSDSKVPQPKTDLKDVDSKVAQPKMDSKVAQPKTDSTRTVVHSSKNTCRPRTYYRTYYCQPRVYWQYQRCQPVMNCVRYFHNCRPVRRCVSRVFWRRCR